MSDPEHGIDTALLRELDERATPGPWSASGHGSSGAQEPESVVVHTGDFDWAALSRGEGGAIAWTDIDLGYEMHCICWVRDHLAQICDLLDGRGPGDLDVEHLREIAHGSPSAVWGVALVDSGFPNVPPTLVIHDAQVGSEDSASITDSPVAFLDEGHSADAELIAALHNVLPLIGAALSGDGHADGEPAGEAERTPTEDEVLLAYQDHRDFASQVQHLGRTDDQETEREFRRWLDARDAQVAARTLRSAAESLLSGTWPESAHPGIGGAVRELTARAELIEQRGRTEEENTHA